MKNKWLLALAGLCFWTACKKDQNPITGGKNNEIIIASSKEQPGIGNSEGLPQVDSLELPEGLEWVRRPDFPFQTDIQFLYGNNNTFYADVHLINHRPDTLTLELPGGLICLFDREGGYQHGLLTSTVRIQVPPTYLDILNPDTTTAYLGLVCLNQHLALPWDENQSWDTQDYPIGKDMYKVYGITQDPNLMQMVRLLAQYPKLKVTKHYNPQEMFEEDYVAPAWLVIYHKIQHAFWKITDGPGLTRKEYQELLEALKAYQ
jgi:hypothetical protein